VDLQKRTSAFPHLSAESGFGYEGSEIICFSGAGSGSENHIRSVSGFGAGFTVELL
jgi:hypothetical protein